MILILAGVYTFMWRYIGLAEAKVFLMAACWSALPILLLRLLLPREFQSWKVPVSVTLMDMVLAFGGTLGVRVVRRAI